MKYPILLEGFDGQTIEVDPPGLLKAARIHVNGNAAPKGKRKGQFLLRRNDGREVTVKIRPSLFYDAPGLEVEGKVVKPG